MGDRVIIGDERPSARAECPAPAPPFGRAAAEGARAVLTVMLIAVAPQGMASAPAMRRALAVAQEAPVFDGFGPEDIRALARIVLKGLATRGPGQVIADVQGFLPRAMAETALALAARAVFQAGTYDRAGLDRLGALAHRLGLPPDTLAVTLDVIAALDRPAPF
ncbi:MAG TPA: hypothetical protein PKD10_17915 [Paracoccaceae bacterium]|nr:hypothetical protein [Paracoccaceae bacterium]HMO73354.1 hypothetical protein [Paracoccaceae bacterium]